LTSPRVLLLDEPSEGIQPSIVDQIANTLRGINERRRGDTVVLVEQNLDFASQLATRAYLVDNGRAVRELPTNDILNDKDMQREHLGIKPNPFEGGDHRD
jgi:ABC-type branched-subunit amino acid transport system ATPase component